MKSQLPASVDSAVLPPPPTSPISTLTHYLKQPLTASFIAGGVAGAVSRTVVSPLERLKIIFQVQGPGNASYNGIGPALVKMWKEEGWRGLMRCALSLCLGIGKVRQALPTPPAYCKDIRRSKILQDIMGRYSITGD